MYFVLGVILGAVVVFLRLRYVERDRTLREEEALRLRHEKELVVRFMHDMVEALGESLSRGDLFQRIVHAAVQCTNALSACVFELTTEGKLRGVAVEGLFPPQRPLPESSREKLTTRARYLEQVLRSEVLEPGEGVIGHVAATRSAELVADCARDPRLPRHDDPSLTVRSLIATPIMFRDNLIGVLAVANPTSQQPFTETDFSLMQTLAEQAGLAIYNNDFLALQVEKHRMDVDLGLARSVQMMLIPAHYPRVPGLDIDARYLPMQKLGGDLVDVLELPDNRLAVIVADVSGKGVAASILMAIGRTRLRHALLHHTSPAAVLREVNRGIRGEMPDDMFITAVVAVIDPGEDSITLARAGHEAPIIGRLDVATSTFQTELIPSRGMALGMADTKVFDARIEDKALPFQAGDTFVLYTDGLTEAANEEGKEFSGARLMDAVRTLRAAPCAELNAGILETVTRFCGRRKLRDDLTLVTVKRMAG
jgi:sigma-B regulation protein RsbU (phosphoserine phosphatase)